MSHYKNVKYPALLLFSVCMSLDAFGTTAASLSVGEENGEVYPKRVRITPPAATIMPTLVDVQTMLRHKSQVLGQVLPEARKNLASIEQALLDKIKGLSRETDFKRIGELAALVSGLAVLDGSSQNICSFATKDCENIDAQVMAGMAVSASGALKEEFRQLVALLAGSEDTRDIDCRILEKSIKAIHKITKDIYNASMLSE